MLQLKDVYKRQAFCKLNYQVAFCDKNELEGQQTAQATGAQFYPVDLNSKEALEPVSYTHLCALSTTACRKQ